MTLPDPEPGLVFRYDYLWLRESRKGKDASKERPACLAVATDSAIEPRLVVILPITHSVPAGETIGIEIPVNIRRHLGLDDQRCWIIVSESNIDTWPNPGISPVRGKTGTFAHGILPAAFFAAVKERMLRHMDVRRSVRR